MLVIGVAAAFVLGDSASASSGSSTPPTWVAIFDLIAGALLLVYVGRNARKMRQPADSKRTADMIEQPVFALCTASVPPSPTTRDSSSPDPGPGWPTFRNRQRA
jgi:hypothetical protein